MLILRFFWWMLVAHITSRQAQSWREFISVLFLIPQGLFAAFWNLSVCSQEEMVREGVVAINQGWRQGALALPPPWVTRRLLALSEQT